MSSSESACASVSIAALYLKFPTFIKRKQLQDHIKKHGFGDNVVAIDMHINLSNRKQAGSAKVSIVPTTLQDKFVSSLNGSRLLGKYQVSVQPYYEQKGQKFKETAKSYQPRAQRKDLHTDQHPQKKEPCIVFVGSGLPHYINKSHIQEHFAEFKDAITNIDIQGRRGCYVLLTFKSSSAAKKAIDRYHRSFLLGKHRIKVEVYKPQHPLSSPASSPAMFVSTHTHNVANPSAKLSSLPDSHSAQGTATLMPTCPSVVACHMTDSLDAHLSEEGGEPHFTKLSPSFRSTVPHASGEMLTVENESISNYNDGEEDQLQHTVTTVIVENLDPTISQIELESLTGVNIDGYIPSDLTPNRVAAWIEVASSECACTIADKLDGKMISGKELHCFLTDSSTLQQQKYSSTLLDQPEEQLPLSQQLDFNTSGPVSQEGYTPLFFLADKHTSQGSQASFSQEAITPFAAHSAPSMPMYELPQMVPVSTM